MILNHFPDNIELVATISKLGGRCGLKLDCAVGTIDIFVTAVRDSTVAMHLYMACDMDFGSVLHVRAKSVRRAYSTSNAVHAMQI